MNRVYLSIPYSSVDHQESFETANRITARLYKMGKVVYSPISHSHPIATQESLPGGFKFWEKIDKCFIDWCDYMVVVKMDGWKESKGVHKEIEYCRSLKKPIVYLGV